MAKSSLDSVTEAANLEVEWRAFELRPKGSPAMDPAYKEKIEASWPQVIAMGRQFGVEMKTHRFGINTRPAHRAFKIVQRLAPEIAETYNNAIFRAYFEEDQDIGETDVLVALARLLDLDTDALRAGLEAGEAEEEVVAEEAVGHRSGISGVPAFVFMDKYLLTGVRPPEDIAAVVAQIRQQE